MNLASSTLKRGLAIAALVVICAAQLTLAGYKNGMNPTNTPSGPGFVGSAAASLGYSLSATNAATTANNVKFNPSAAVGATNGTWTAQTTAPGKSPAGATSQIYVNPTLPGGPKVLVYSATPSGAAGVGSADPSPELADRLAQDGFVLTPYACGAGYNMAFGDEVINGQHYLVVLGTSTPGTAHWFRGYFFNGVGPTDRDQVINQGTKLYDLVVLGPFDFGDPNSPDRCNALKIPINYTGPYLYLISDGTASSTTDLQIVNCPAVTLAACNPSYPTNLFTTSGGCGAVVVTFDTDPNSIAAGASATVTAMATDAAGNNATCTFTATRTGLQFTGCPPNSTIPLAACNPSYPTNSFTTTGGCGKVTISFSPAASSIPLGATSVGVTATATDANGTTATCGFTVSRAATLQFTGCPSSIALGACNPPNYPTNMFTTGGGCAPVIISFSPPASSIVPGAPPVAATATATDANGSTASCPFSVSRPVLQISGCPTGPLDFSTCGTKVAYPTLTPTGGCAPMTLTFNPANVSALLPGINNVIATATDANGSVVTCPFQVIRPYLSLGSSGFQSPIGGTGGNCTNPLRVNNSGNNLKIAFSTYLCGTNYDAIVPKITITKLDPTTCAATSTPVNQQAVTLVNTQWHYNWSTGGNLGYFLITVDLGDKNPNPSLNSATVLMQ